MKWVESYLTNRSHSVSINNHRSKSLQLPTGVPHGSILGPLLFSIYINDLPSVCPEVETIMYADDTVFFVYGRAKADVVDKFNRSVAQVTTWLGECCLQLNVWKTVSMFFCKTNKPTCDHHIIVAGENVQVMSVSKYLGVLIDSNLSFKAHVKKNLQYYYIQYRKFPFHQRLPKCFYTL